MKFISFELPVKECATCKKPMMKKDGSGLFSIWFEKNQTAQMKANDVVFVSNSRVEGELICVECEKKGLSSFECKGCNQTKPSSKKQKSFGCRCESDYDDMDYLCSDCYSSLSAKVWDEISAALEKEHEYDHL